MYKKVKIAAMHIIDIELLSLFQCTRATIGTTYYELWGLFSQSNNTNAVRGIGNIVQEEI